MATDRPGTSAATDADWYTFSADLVATTLDVDPARGLSAARAAELLAANGPNALPGEQPTPGWRRFLDQYRTYMQLILCGAAVVSLLVQEWSTAVLLVFLTVLNVVVGLRQEGKAESAMNALKSMMKASARVRRDGIEAAIPADQLVVGDVVLIAAGDQVPADGRIVAAEPLQIDESALTGESVPAAKDAEVVTGSSLGPGDQTNMAFMNTPVTHGSGTVIVTGTGSATELGKISGMLSATPMEQSPLTKELNVLSLWIAGAAGLTMLVMFTLGRYRGTAWDALFVSAVSLAIAAIPEALPTVTQVILSLGSIDLAKRNAIVKDLPSVETLGFTSAINSDKTGTLTMNQMTAVEVVAVDNRYTITGIGYGLDGAIQHPVGAAASIDDAILPYVIANDAALVDGRVVGDPTEGALLVLAHKAGLNIDGTRERFPRLATLPFDPTYKLMATFNSDADSAGRPVVRCFVKGAAPAVMQRATSALAPSGATAWDADAAARGTAEMERMEAEGYRVMAAASRDLDPDDFDPNGDLLAYTRELQMTSLVGMVDPPRDESKAAVADAQAAHIRVRMVTGDDVTTGAAIATQLGIPGEAMLGADFAALTEEERLARIDDIGVVGRVAPEHKVLLADTLKKKGDVVAMTGDGVNDAPAIKAADIGIAMGSGTDVAKNAGRMILSDDNFATIVFAVEQGRKIYDNLTKYIRFVLVLLVVFVLTFLGATLFNLAAGEPFTPAQVLWIHFFVNAPFGFALGFDRGTPGLMSLRPRPRGESVLTRPVVITVGLVGLAMTVALLLLIQLGHSEFGSVEIGQSIAFTSFALMLIVAAFECRSETESVFTTSTFDSKQMNWAVFGELVLAVLTTQMDALRHVLGTTDITMREFRWALIPVVALLVLWELGKFVARSRRADVHDDAAAPTHLSIRQAAFIGVGAMVGAGIFSLLGAAGEVAGAAVWLSFALAGAVAGLQGYSFAKLGARYLSAGGLLEYVARGWGDGHFTGIIAWLILATNAIVTSMVAVSFGSYASSAVSDGNTSWAKFFGVAIVVVMTLLNVVGSQAVARVQTVVVVVVISILAVFAVVTIANMQPHLLAFSGYPSVKDIVSSVALTFFAFLGFGVVTFTAKDLAEPAWELPRAMFLALGIATVIYIAVSLGVFGTPTVDQVIASGGTAIAVAAQPVLGRAGYWLMSVTALFATVGATNAGLYPAPGLCEQMATTGQFPPLLGRRFVDRVPAGLILTATIAIVLTVGFDLTAIASIGSAIALLVFALVSAGHMRVRHETGARTGMLIAAVLSAAVVLVAFALTTLITEPGTVVAIVAILTLSVALDFGWKRVRPDAIPLA